MVAVEEKKVIQTPKVRKEEISHAAAAILAAQDIPESQTTPVVQESHMMIQTKNMIQINHMVLTNQEGQITLEALNTQNIHAVQKSLRTTKVARIIKAKTNQESQILLENYLDLFL